MNAKLRESNRYVSSEPPNSNDVGKNNPSGDETPISEMRPSYSKLESYIKGDIPVERILSKGKRAERFVKLREKRLRDGRRQLAENILQDLLDSRKEERKNFNDAGWEGSCLRSRGLRYESSALYTIHEDDRESQENELELVSREESRVRNLRNQRGECSNDTLSSIAPAIKSCKRGDATSSVIESRNRSAKQSRTRSEGKSPNNSVEKSQNHFVEKSRNRVAKSRDYAAEESQNHLASQSRNHLVVENRNPSVAKSGNSSDEILRNNPAEKFHYRSVAKSRSPDAGKSENHSIVESRDQSVARFENQPIAKSQDQHVAKCQNYSSAMFQRHSEQNSVVKFALSDVNEAERLRVEAKYLKKVEARRANIVKKCEAIARSFCQENEKLRMDNERMNRELTQILEEFRRCGQTSDSKNEQFEIICHKIEKVNEGIRQWREKCIGPKKISDDDHVRASEQMEMELKELLQRNLEAQNEIDVFRNAKDVSLQRERTFLNEMREREREYKGRNEQLFRQIELLNASLLRETRKCANLSLRSKNLEDQLQDSKNANSELEEKTRIMIAELKAIVTDHEKLNERLNKERNFLKNAAVKLSEEMENLEKRRMQERKAKDELDDSLRKERLERLNERKIDIEPRKARDQLRNVKKGVEENLENGESSARLIAKIELKTLENEEQNEETLETDDNFKDDFVNPKLRPEIDAIESAKINNNEVSPKRAKNEENERATLKEPENNRRDPNDVRITQLFREFCEHVSKGEARRIVFPDKIREIAQTIPKADVEKSHQTPQKNLEIRFAENQEREKSDPFQEGVRKSLENEESWQMKAQKLRGISENSRTNAEDLQGICENPREIFQKRGTRCKNIWDKMSRLYDEIDEYINTRQAKGILIQSEPPFVYSLRVKRDPALKEIARDLARNGDYIVSKMSAQTGNISTGDLTSDEQLVSKLFRAICEKIAKSDDVNLVVLTSDGECFVIASISSTDNNADYSDSFKFENILDNEECCDENYDLSRLRQVRSSRDGEDCCDSSNGEGIRNRIFGVVASWYNTFINAI